MSNLDMISAQTPSVVSQMNPAERSNQLRDQAAVNQQSGADRSNTQASNQLALEDVADQLKDFLGNQDGVSFNISIDRDLKEPVIQILDGNSGERVKQIPSEQALQISRAILEMRGLFVDESA